jgi:glyceraldehyde-3-phosphate dehydrogenase type II
MWMDLYAGHEYGKNPRKHTVNVQPAELLSVDITADAPGQWAFHCHTIRADEGIVALNSTIELMNDLERPRGDMWEVALWEDILTVDGDQAYYTYQVDNQAIVIPETIDAIRALTEAVANDAESVARTNEAMGIRKNFLEG